MSVVHHLGYQFGKVLEPLDIADKQVLYKSHGGSDYLVNDQVTEDADLHGHDHAPELADASLLMENDCGCNH
jgi:hypothetical protein